MVLIDWLIDWLMVLIGGCDPDVLGVRPCARNDPKAGNVVVRAAQPEDALERNIPGASDGFVYRVEMMMGAGRPLADVVSTLAIPGPFTLYTDKPKAWLCRHQPSLRDSWRRLLSLYACPG